MLDRSPKIRKKVLKSIESISKGYEHKSALQGVENSQLARMRIKNYNSSFPHKDPNIIEALVSNEASSTTANRIEQILTRKWFEQAGNY